MLMVIENDILRIEKLRGFIKYDRSKIENKVNEFITGLY
jgi:hypothetical protein